jgi:hypothetical protein
MTLSQCGLIIGGILALALLGWILDQALYPPVPDELVTRRRRATPWYR